MERHARASDPPQSDRTVKSLDLDTSLKGRIWRAVLRMDGSRGASDDEIWTFLETHDGCRYQRNVIARTRGLMELDGLLERVESEPRVRVRIPQPPATTLF